MQEPCRQLFENLQKDLKLFLESADKVVMLERTAKRNRGTKLEIRKVTR